MTELDDFEPFDAQSLVPMDYWEANKMKRMINILVEEVKELKKKQ